ncbi:hypothetical protein EYF80_004050 [Liparis tanakae]|uniref:Uncharacterized protein n=1 Tax=Liparis tanakae TaxID=230148 RepID=A0A4Z2J836_9TELE|nr:hypothetical protein EYF80_004050 [Liparis tanakae]
MEEIKPSASGYSITLPYTGGKALNPKDSSHGLGPQHQYKFWPVWQKHEQTVYSVVGKGATIGLSTSTREIGIRGHDETSDRVGMPSCVGTDNMWRTGVVAAKDSWKDKRDKSVSFESVKAIQVIVATNCQELRPCTQSSVQAYILSHLHPFPSANLWSSVTVSPPAPFIFSYFCPAHMHKI